MYIVPSLQSCGIVKCFSVHAHTSMLYNMYMYYYYYMYMCSLLYMNVKRVPYSPDITPPSIISCPLTICINLLQRYIPPLGHTWKLIS